MDHRNRPAPHRGRGSPARAGVRDRFEWTRGAGIGPALAVLGDLTGKRVVELGCGGGHNLAYLAAHHHIDAVGIDHDSLKIHRAQAAYGTLPGLSFVRQDAESFLRSQPVTSLDLCLSIFGAFSFTPPGPLTAATARALRPGGLLALTLRATDTTDLVLVLSRR